MQDQCKRCDRKRSDGWLLIGGLCLDCGPDEFEARRAELRLQLAELMRDER